MKHKFSRRELNLIASFRGIPQSATPSYGKPILSIGSVVHQLLETSSARATRLDLLKSLWREAVGENLATFSTPTKITSKTLTITTKNPIVKQELGFMQQEILQRVRRLESFETLQNIKIL